MEISVVKAVLLGNSSVGKTSIRNRNKTGSFDSMVRPTIGADYEIVKRRVEGNDIKILIYDTSGQEKYDSLSKNYYRNSQMAIFVYSVDDKESFEKIESWMQKARDNTP